MLFCDNCGEGVRIAYRVYVLDEETDRVNEQSLCNVCVEDLENE